MLLFLMRIAYLMMLEKFAIHMGMPMGESGEVKLFSTDNMGTFLESGEFPRFQRFLDKF